ncbi:DUF302 domain-containing protein [Sulfurimonas sp. SAG-AH-194-L11]|nr:DUF302 domain-containing protein [Sulfurimonas sp. SAG-AH-194-L11]MDF1877096.1 DUF302 domain-containing protein [Sulfurimonas sp. SAG-AH-194-L11]
MIYKTQTHYPIDTVKSQLKEKAKSVGFGILGSYEFKKILKNKGFEIEKDITVYELCNPSAAASALNTLAEISVYLPCRLSIYDENGVTILSTIGIEDILSSTGIEGELKQHMQEIFEKIRALMNSW